MADIYIGALTITDVSKKTTPDASVKIDEADLGYLAAKKLKYADKEVAEITKKSIVEQQSCAVYANVYAGKTLKGSFKYAETYKADEVVEE